MPYLIMTEEQDLEVDTQDFVPKTENDASYMAPLLVPTCQNLYVSAIQKCKCNILRPISSATKIRLQPYFFRLAYPKNYGLKKT